MNRVDQRGTTLTETLLGMALLAYVSLMLLQIVASASSVDIKLRARTEAWQTLNALAVPAQHVDCTQPSRLDVCKPEELLARTHPRVSVIKNFLLFPSAQEYVYVGEFGTYRIGLNDSAVCLPVEVPPLVLPDCAYPSPPGGNGEPVPSRDISVSWTPGGSPSETIDHKVFGPWS